MTWWAELIKLIKFINTQNGLKILCNKGNQVCLKKNKRTKIWEI